MAYKQSRGILRTLTCAILMVNHREKGKVVMISIKEQMVSRLAHRPGDSAQTENSSSHMDHTIIHDLLTL